MRRFALGQTSRPGNDRHDRWNGEEDVELSGGDEDGAGDSGDETDQHENEVGNIEPTM
ncbi:hypothetical protein [Clavibacter michiganensis]|uniref:hypothetical protein n=1 Tax=Clavibacter michiganensis TaxID=28447 RepID=UPI001293C497|nr:hypothetical protein [Clavibacter michiganensis]